MRRFASSLVVIGAFALLGAEGAMACSCAEDGKPDTLRGLDAAATARLIDVEQEDPPESGPISSPRATFTYRLLRVYKGSKGYNLREGENLVFENSTEGSSCGLPTEEGRRYGLGLFKTRDGLNSGLCLLRSPKELRRAAERSGNARSTRSGDARAPRRSGNAPPARAACAR